MDRPSLISAHPLPPRQSRPKSLAWVVMLSLGLVGFSVVATLTNPDQAAYETYLSHQALSQLETQFCSPTSTTDRLGLGQFVQQGCQSLLQQGQHPLKELIGYHTTRHNLGLVSLYTTELPAVTRKKIWAIGFLGQIYLLQ
ncbi:DUF4359 domain-containing protein [Thermosynechococcaceae cyanobacterium BACA0444]|uniref:DUF4359 domain-containing protein n=1 Tax=Pseudocalidococcus azoricus BACA0444 TaxID=2918990 RepID=A0AAE4JYM9_9CYAN|nr:DUF4359 domain-containing protein [Pseudocalidococcus azoricus]MDS3862348.1 DUF4359 domain-containing protein [Pseudocalidococcus azoricus BACA0444]